MNATNYSEENKHFDTKSTSLQKRFGSTQHVSRSIIQSARAFHASLNQNGVPYVDGTKTSIDKG